MKPQISFPRVTYPDATSKTVIANGVARAYHPQATLTVCAVEMIIAENPTALSSLIMDAAEMGARRRGGLRPSSPTRIGAPAGTAVALRLA
ncbi:hypothetical protein [Rhizobium sp. MHM7A]|uniref:hypothetical protein n=1 Tax=Rhizobium sp. MHM7A TaxID=2583233 RepID=UPI0011075387|nr:hypothetical protein [Rhizobium sp. MHM7A]TLX08840.1 hypothetical protein FFR93_27455 [Rhizobium sp. MHM7A]